MIRGGDFYAIWIEERGLWSTDEQDALQLIDRELDRYAEKLADLLILRQKAKFHGNAKYKPGHSIGTVLSFQPPDFSVCPLYHPYNSFCITVSDVGYIM